MNWTTEKINKIEESFKRNPNFTNLLREISLEYLLSGDETPLQFPFVYPKYNAPDFSLEYKNIEEELILKAEGILFQYTDSEIKELLEIQINYIRFLSYFNFGIYDVKFFKEYLEMGKVIVMDNEAEKLSSYIAMVTVLHYILNNENKKICICGNSISGMSIIFLNTYRKLPFFLRPAVKPSETEFFDFDFPHKCPMRFDNGCELYFRYPSKMNQDTLSMNFDYLLLDNGWYESINSLPKILLMSTPKTLIFNVKKDGKKSIKKHFKL